MRRGGEASWRIAVDRWNQQYDCALWVRAVERIEVPADALVPGPLELEPVPSASTAPDPVLADAWLVAWRDLATLPRWQPGSQLPPPRSAFAAPEFLGLASWPSLRQVLHRRWQEAYAWSEARKQAGLAAWSPDQHRDTEVVREVERLLGRPVRPFDVEFVLLPVREETVRRVHDNRYLVPERAYDSPQWSDWLRELVRRIG